MRSYLLFVVAMLVGCSEQPDNSVIVVFADTGVTAADASGCSPACETVSRCDGEVGVRTPSVCTDGQCLPGEPNRQDCAESGEVCAGGECVDADSPCAGVDCQLPSPSCEGDVARIPSSAACDPGNGECVVSYTDRDCAVLGQVCQQGQCVAGRKRVFVTAQRYSGDFDSIGGGQIGYLAADAICGAEAQAAGIGGRWFAYVSEFGDDIKDRFQNVDGGWYTPDRVTLVTESRADLILNGPKIPINRLPTGEQLAPIDQADGEVWTATNDLGNVTVGVDCVQWSSESAVDRGTVGSVSTNVDPEWCDIGEVVCSEQRRLYCFER